MRSVEGDIAFSLDERRRKLVDMRSPIRLRNGSSGMLSRQLGIEVGIGGGC